MIKMRATRRISTVVTLVALLASCGDSPIDDPAKAIALEAGGTMMAARGTVALTTPDNPGWRDVPEYRIALEMAPPVHPSVDLRQTGDEQPTPVFVRVASDGQSLFVRLRWQDATANTRHAYEDYADGAAVQFALQGGEDTSYMMGDPEAPVNIWYWNAGSESPQNLAAGGFGSTTRLDTGALTATARHSADAGDQWAVVFSRPLQVDGEYQADLGSLDGVQMAFAVWQGADNERDGLKRTTADWISLTVQAGN